MPTTRAMLSIHYSRQDASLTAHESLYYITQGTFGVAAGWWHFSDARGVCCCSSTSLSPARVSTQFTFSPKMPAPMPCAHLRATLRFRSRLLPHTLMCATHASLSQGHIGARRRAAKPQDGSRQRIDYYYGRLRQSRDSRGQRGAQDASAGTALAHTHVRAGLMLARSRLAQQFSGRVCHRGCGPAFRGCRRGRLAQARSQ